MSPTQISLAWNTFENNICDGLSLFQQREEFVDMTLAADGHFVKVHQMVISLASPYLKELIMSAPCPHPVLFLNNISHRILCSILEYIYSGEVVIEKEDIGDLMQAGKALHIRGLEDMNLSDIKVVEEPAIQRIAADVKLYNPAGNLLRKRKSGNDQSFTQGFKIKKTIDGNLSSAYELQQDSNMDEVLEDPFQNINLSFQSDKNRDDHSHLDDHSQNETEDQTNTALSSNDGVKPTIQYTLSNQGHLQMILNRYMYGITYQYKNSKARLWKCIDVRKSKCPAIVTTKDDLVVQRAGVHNHSFHDNKILKKVEAGMVVTAIRDAEIKGQAMREQNE